MLTRVVVRIWLWGWIFAAPAVWSTVLEVPGQYGTIQAALDSLSAGDTVLVDSGLYGEVLHAPCMTFTLLGNVANDSDLAHRPVIDPTLAVPPADSALTLCGPNPTVIRHVVFRNHLNRYGKGGIRALGNGSLTVSHCRFDSTGIGIALHDTLTRVELTSCVFRGCRDLCIQVVNPGPRYSPGRLTARHCTFSGHTASADGIVYLTDSCRLDSCTFTDIGGLAMLHARGKGVSITGCTFGPSNTHIFNVLEVNYSGTRPASVRIEGNTFAHIRQCSMTMILANGNCQGDSIAIIRGNRFYDNWNVSDCVPTIVTGSMVDTSCYDQPFTMVIEDNEFQACFAPHTGEAIENWVGTYEMPGNTFRGFRDPNVAAVRVLPNAHATQVMHGNQFIDVETALANASMLFPVDATLNWWGDSTGPYNAVHNPQGHGARIYGPGGIRFEPWLRDSLLGEESADPHAAVAESPLLLEVYPNPFNAQARIRLTVQSAGVYRVELYNLLGQKIAVVFEGAVVREVMLPLHAEGLASGIYWLRAEDRLTRAVGMAKVLVLK